MMRLSFLWSNRRRIAGSVYQWSLLDWWPVLIGRQPFPDQDPKLPTQVQLREIFNELDEKSVDSWLAFVDGLQSDNESRRAILESKASMLSGSATIAVGLLTGFAGTMLDKGQVSNIAISWILIGLYSTAALMFLLSMVLSMRCLRAMSYPFMVLRHADMLAMARAPMLDIKVHRLVELYRCQGYNRVLINRKATYTTGAQDCFVRGTFIAFWAAVIIASYSVIARVERDHDSVMQGADAVAIARTEVRINLFIPMSASP